MRIRGFFAQHAASAPALALIPDTITIPEIADVIDCTPTEAVTHATGYLLANLGPFFTCDGQLAAYCAMAFAENGASATAA